MMALLIWTAVAFAIGIPATIYRGWVLTLLWSWYFVPIGMPPIGIVTAIGVSLTVNFLSQGYIPPKILEADEYGITALFYSIVASTLALIFGAIIAVFR